MEWQPIETLLKVPDGEMVSKPFLIGVINEPDSVREGYLHMNGWVYTTTHENEGFHCAPVKHDAIRAVSHEDTWKPTHWMPLPPPPKPESG